MKRRNKKQKQLNQKNGGNKNKSNKKNDIDNILNFINNKTSETPTIIKENIQKSEEFEFIKIPEKRPEQIKSILKSLNNKKEDDAIKFIEAFFHRLGFQELNKLAQAKVQVVADKLQQKFTNDYINIDTMAFQQLCLKGFINFRANTRDAESLTKYVYRISTDDMNQYIKSVSTECSLFNAALINGKYKFVLKLLELNSKHNNLGKFSFEGNYISNIDPLNVIISQKCIKDLDEEKDSLLLEIFKQIIELDHYSILDSGSNRLSFCYMLTNKEDKDNALLNALINSTKNIKTLSSPFVYGNGKGNFAKITLLMQYCCNNNFEAVKLLVEKAKVDLSVTVNSKEREVYGVSIKDRNDTESDKIRKVEMPEHQKKDALICNAFSFASSEKIMLYLLSKDVNLLTLHFVNRVDQNDLSYIVKHYNKMLLCLDECLKYNKLLEIIENKIYKNDKEIIKLQKAANKSTKQFENFSDIQEQKLVDTKVVTSVPITSNSNNIEKTNAKQNLSNSKIVELSENLIIDYVINYSQDSFSKLKELLSKHEFLKKEFLSLIPKEAYTKDISAEYIEKLLFEIIKDPKIFHKYFEIKKQLVQQKIENMCLKKISEQSWVINGKEYYSESSKIVKISSSSLKKEFFFTITPELYKEDMTGLDNIQFIAKDSKGRNGIKYRTDLNLYILKTKQLGDERIVADKYYVNKNDKVLIIFDKQYTHTQLDNLPKNINHFEEISVLSFIDLDNDDTIKNLGEDNSNYDL